MFMFLNSPTQSLDISLRVKYEVGYCLVLASTGHLKCFECSDVGHKRFACAHYEQWTEGTGKAAAARAELAADGLSGHTPQNQPEADKATRSVRKQTNEARTEISENEERKEINTLGKDGAGSGAAVEAEPGLSKHVGFS